MTASTVELQGMPYLPGRASGPLALPGAAQTPGAIQLLTPATLASADPAAGGLLMVEVAPFSHAAIATRHLGLPTVILDRVAAAALRPERTVALDGGSGRVTAGDGTGIGPAPAGLPVPPAGHPVRCADGTPLRLLASVRGPAGARQAMSFGAAGIGLLRSEFLVPEHGGQPDLDYFRLVLGEICAAVDGLPLNLRLVDLAPDKRPSWLPPLPGLDTPLGLQGMRLFDQPAVRAVVEGQLDAAAALAGGCDLGLILPYATRYEELARWLGHIRARVPAGLRVGSMAETPAGVLSLRSWLELADFVSVGCNDLMQCLFAADRDQPAVAGFLDPYSPALYRLLRDAALDAGDRLAGVQLCGLLPQLPGTLALLVGLGFRAFSVDPPLVPHLAAAAASLDVAEARRRAEAACAARTCRELREQLGLSR